MLFSKIQPQYLQSLQNSSRHLVSNEAPTVPFSQFFDEAVVQQAPVLKSPVVPVNPMHFPLTEHAAVLAQAINQEELERIDRRRKRNREVVQEEFDGGRVADVFDDSFMAVTPFQLFLDKSIEVLENISQQEFRVNDLTEQYLAGKVSIDEVSIETTKLNMAMTFATTVVQAAATMLKELSGMQI